MEWRSVWALFTLRGRTRVALVGVGVAVATLLVLIAPELPRLLEFKDFRALDPSKANEGGLGNLPGEISPLTALGIWPTGEFRLSAGASSLPTIVFYAGALLAAVAFALALPRWIRRYGAAIPAALVAAVVLYIAARALGTVYTSAKAISIAAPLVALVTLGGLFAAKRPAMTALATVFAIAAAGSSFLILRQAPVGPEDHMQELAEIRPSVEGEKLLFLGRDNFVLYELRGSKPFTSVKNFYDPYFVEPNAELANVFSKFDFDSVTAETLARFRYVLATRAAYASGPPPGYEVIERTDSYELWQRGESPLGREPGETDAEPGRLGGCDGASTAEVSAFARPPVVADGWSARTIEGGDEDAVLELDLPAGEWELSIQYDSTRELTIDGPGLDATLPGNLDYRGPAAFFAVGPISSDGDAPTTITATVEDLPAARSAARCQLGCPSRDRRRDHDRAAHRQLRRLRRLVRVRHEHRRLARCGEQLFGKLAEEVAAGDDRMHLAAGCDRDHEHAVMQEELGHAGVGVLVVDDDVVGGQVLADRFAGAGLATLDHLVDRALDHRRGAELADVTRKQRRHELALAEDAREAAIGLDRGQARQLGLDQPLHGWPDQLVGRERLDLRRAELASLVGHRLL